MNIVRCLTIGDNRSCFSHKSLTPRHLSLLQRECRGVCLHRTVLPPRLSAEVVRPEGDFQLAGQILHGPIEGLDVTVL